MISLIENLVCTDDKEYFQEIYLNLPHIYYITSIFNGLLRALFINIDKKYSFEIRIEFDYILNKCGITN